MMFIGRFFFFAFSIQKCIFAIFISIFFYMKLFFDSGATKCDCILLNDNGLYINHYTHNGINVSYTDDSTIGQTLQFFQKKIGQPVKQIVFSGAGCGNPSNQTRLGKILTALFPQSEVQVISDLLGACIVLSCREPSLVAILGTGSSACRYDGKKIAEQAPSLGYLLGDEGSGTYLGKTLIQKYLRKELPDSICTELEERFQLTPSETIRKIYREPAPNLFFSLFAKFLAEKRNEPVIHQLLLHAFSDFFEMQIKYLSHFQSYPLHCTGSIAYHFQDILREIAEQYQVHIGNISPSPLEKIKISGIQL